MAVNVVYTGGRSKQPFKELDLSHLKGVDEITEQVLSEQTTSVENGMRTTRDATGQVVSQSLEAGDDYINPGVLDSIDQQYNARRFEGEAEASRTGEVYSDEANARQRAEEQNVERLSPTPVVAERPAPVTLHDKLVANQEAAEVILDRKGEAAYNVPDLSQQQMKAYLDSFIVDEYNGTITAAEVTQNPDLYQEFGLYLGRMEEVVSPDKFVKYIDGGGTSGERTATAFLQPEIASIVNAGPGIEQIPGFKSIQKLADLTDMAIHINQSDDEGNRNFHAMLGTKEGTLERETAEMQDRFHEAMQNQFRQMGVSEASKWADRISGEHEGSNVDSVKELVYWLAGNYAAIEEARVTGRNISEHVTRGLADSFILSVLSVMKKQAYNSIEDKDFQELLDPKTKRQVDLMHSGLDAQIGHAIFEALGLVNEMSDQKTQMTNPDGSVSEVEADPETEESLRNYKKWAGSFARNMVGDIFSFTPQIRDVDQSTGEEIYAYDVTTGKPIYEIGPAQQKMDVIDKNVYNSKYDIFRNVLFEVVPATKVLGVDGKPEVDPDTGRKTNRMTQRGVRLTDNGFKVVDVLQPLINMLIPSAVVEPNFTKPETFLKNKEGMYINLKGQPIDKEAGETPVPIWDMNAAQIRKFRGTEAYKKQGSVVKQSYNQHIKSLAGARVGKNTLALIQQMYADESAQTLLDGPDYLNISGDGLPPSHPMYQQDGYVGKGTRDGRTRQRAQKEKGQVLNDSQGQPVMDFFIGDFLKDRKLLESLTWSKNNVDKVYYFDYFVGRNRREFVKQTLFNFQNDKLSRALLEAGEPRIYSFSNSVIYDLPTGKITEMDYFKAQVLRKFGLKGNVFDLAPKFNDTAKDWKQMRDTGNFGGLAKAGELEGFMSISAIAEGINLYEAEQLSKQNGKKNDVYISGFLTEADGLTNGMAHSSLQTADPLLAQSTLLFVEEQKKRILDNGYNFANPDAYYRAYNKTQGIANDVLKGSKFSQVISKQTNQKMLDLLKVYDKQGTHVKFSEAVNILKSSGQVFGRKFAKQPVMIFGYGAGPAMIRSAVREFMYEWFENQEGGNNLKLEMEAIPNFDLEEDFITPMGILMTEALHTEFADVLQLSQTLSKAAVAGVAQGMPLSTYSGQGWAHPLGIIDTEIDESRTRSFTRSFHRVGVGPNKDAKGNNLPGGFKPNSVGQLLPEAVTEDKDKSHKVQIKESTKTFDPAGSFAANSLKAGTQIAVLLNHGNDSYNMGEALTEVHFMLEAMGKKTGAHHVFDAVLAPPQDMPMYVKSLNKHFLEINQENSHVMTVYDGLTYEHDIQGEKIIETVQRGMNLSQATKNQLHLVRKVDPHNTMYKRQLKKDQMQSDGIEVEDGESTWDAKFDSYAFSWSKPQTGLNLTWKDPKTGVVDDSFVPVADTHEILNEIINIQERRLEMFKKSFPMAFQFNDGSI